jgi:hypothetical protein
VLAIVVASALCKIPPQVSYFQKNIVFEAAATTSTLVGIIDVGKKYQYKNDEAMGLRVVSVCVCMAETFFS